MLSAAKLSLDTVSSKAVWQVSNAQYCVITFHFLPTNSWAHLGSHGNIIKFQSCLQFTKRQQNVTQGRWKLQGNLNLDDKNPDIYEKLFCASSRESDAYFWSPRLQYSDPQIISETNVGASTILCSNVQSVRGAIRVDKNASLDQKDSFLVLLTCPWVATWHSKVPKRKCKACQMICALKLGISIPQLAVLSQQSELETNIWTLASQAREDATAWAKP